jgi:hypothetical protein
MATMILWVVLAATPSVPTCAEPPKEHREALPIPRPLFEDAKKRAKLADLLIESLRATSRHEVDAKREREIRKLAKQLAGKEEK